MECGATCLRMVARHYGKIYSAEYMRRLCAVSHIGVSMQSMNEAAKSIGFQTVCGRMTQSKLIEQRPFPCILHWQQEHFVVLYDVKVKRNGKTVFYIADPGKCLLKVEEEAFLKAWTGKEEDKEGKGILMALRPTDEFYRQHVAITRPCRYWTECRTSSCRTANTASVGNGKMYKSASNASMEDYSIHCFIPTLPFETFPTIAQLN